jgi:ribokinase
MELTGAPMAKIVVLGSIARDDVIQMQERVREGKHLQGSPPLARLGGGGANTAIALAHAGHEVSLVAAVGTDSLAEELLAEVSRHGVDIGPVTRVTGASTHSLVLLSPDGERTIVNLTRARESRPPRRLLDLEADCVYVRAHGQDLGELLRAKSKLCPVIAQMQSMEAGPLPVQVLVGSHADLDEGIRADPLAAGRRLAGERLQWVVVTRGGEGAEAFGTDGRRLCATAPDVAVLDTTGAGDSFAAGLAHALALGMDMPQALPLAVLWGAAKVSRMGSFLDRGAVREVLREWTGRSSANRP